MKQTLDALCAAAFPSSNFMQQRIGSFETIICVSSLPRTPQEEKPLTFFFSLLHFEGGRPKAHSSEGQSFVMSQWVLVPHSVIVAMCLFSYDTVCVQMFTESILP